jgi:multidrug efflux pump
MNISAPFIHRPVATTLLTVAVGSGRGNRLQSAAGLAAAPGRFSHDLRQRLLPGASADIMASSVATPLERQFGHIAGVTEMSSSSSLGTTSVTIQFDLAATSMAQPATSRLPSMRRALICPPISRQPDLSQGQSGRRADHDPRSHLGQIRPAKLYDEASTVIEQKFSQIQGVGQVSSAAAPCRRSGWTSIRRSWPATASRCQASNPC